MIKTRVGYFAAELSYECYTQIPLIIYESLSSGVQLSDASVTVPITHHNIVINL